MAGRVRYHLGARADIREAHRYYLEQGDGVRLADRFREDLKATIGMIAKRPLAWPEKMDARCCVMKRFPFSIYYEILGDDLFVVAIANHKMRPGFWRDRV